MTWPSWLGAYPLVKMQVRGGPDMKERPLAALDCSNTNDCVQVYLFCSPKHWYCFVTRAALHEPKSPLSKQSIFLPPKASASV